MTSSGSSSWPTRSRLPDLSATERVTFAAGRLVEVAVDAPGVRGGQTFTYRVPETLSGVAPGDAVVVEYGRQPTVAVVLAEVESGGDGLLLGDDATTGFGLAPAREIKPILDRIGDEPLLPALTARLAA